MPFGIDLSPLRESKQYRRLFVAGTVGIIGGQATYVATGFQLRQLTHSVVMVGALGLVELLPLLAFGLYGGVIADRMDRKRLALLAEGGLMLFTALLMVNAFIPHPQVWAIFVFDTGIVICGALQNPTISALYQSFVSHDMQRAASVLSSIRASAVSIIGPALGGLLASLLGPGWAYGFNIVTFVFSLFLLSLLERVPTPAREHTSTGAMFAEGLRYAKSRPDIVGTYVIDIFAMALAFPVMFFPFVAAWFHASYALSVIYMGLPTGALIATVASGWTKKVHRYGRAIVLAAIGWGLGIAIFGVAKSLWLVVLGLVIAGATDAYSAVFRATLWNQSIPPDVRGRMGGIEMISYSVGPLAGSFRAGLVASWIGLRSSLSLGGLCASGSVGTVALALPSLWTFDSRTNVHVAEVRALREAE